jgi:hypothetical protein
MDRSDAVYVLVAAHSPFAHCSAGAASVLVVESFPEPPQPAATVAVATTRRRRAIGHRRLTPTCLHVGERSVRRPMIRAAMTADPRTIRRHPLLRRIDTVVAVLVARLRVRPRETL